MATELEKSERWDVDSGSINSDLAIRWSKPRVQLPNLPLSPQLFLSSTFYEPSYPRCPPTKRKSSASLSFKLTAAATTCTFLFTAKVSRCVSRASLFAPRCQRVFHRLSSCFIVYAASKFLDEVRHFPLEPCLFFEAGRLMVRIRIVRFCSTPAATR